MRAEEKGHGGARYWMVLVVASGMVAASYGMLANVGGLFFKPIAAELGLGIGQVSMTLTISNLLMALGGLASPKLLKPERMKPVIVAAVSVLVLASAGLAAVSDLRLMYLLNGVRGFSAGVVGMVPGTILLNNWYHKRTGTVISIAMGFSGITSALVSPLLSKIIMSFGWRAAYFTTAVLILLIHLPSMVFPIAFRPEMLGMKPYGAEDEAARAASADTVAVGIPDQSSDEIRKSLVFAAVLFSILGSFLTAFTQHFPVLAANYGSTVMVGSAMLSATMVMNTGGKLIFGSMADKFGTMKLIFIGVLIVIVACLLLMIPNPALLVPAAAMYGCCFALSTVALSLMTKDIFGAKNYAKVFPLANMSGMAANALTTTVIGLLYDVSGSYHLVSICMIVTLLAILLTAAVAYRNA